MALLSEVDLLLNRKIVLVAAGGTALTLLKVKPSTIDIDFTGPADDIDEFSRVEKLVPHGFRIDGYKDGAVFTQILPGDYLQKSKRIKTNLRKIDLRALHPLDIVASKVGRLDERDKQDIAACIEKFRLAKDEVRKRSKKVQYAGNEDIYSGNLKYVLDNFFRPHRTRRRRRRRGMP
ncbi:MAG: DUF6036 family nucleotidyltransferase [Nitrososphaera sp.]